MPSLKTPLRFLEAISLDLLSLPGRFMSKEGNAKLHLNYICPLCSRWRQSFRDPKRKSDCLWREEWGKGNYDFPRDFGITNWLKYYLGLKTDLTKYQKRQK